MKTCYDKKLCEYCCFSFYEFLSPKCPETPNSHTTDNITLFTIILIFDAQVMYCLSNEVKFEKKI